MQFKSEIPNFKLLVALPNNVGAGKIVNVTDSFH